MANLPPVSTTPAATLPPVSMTLVAKFATSTAGVVDTHVEVANVVKKIPVTNIGNNIRLLTL